MLIEGGASGALKPIAAVQLPDGTWGALRVSADVQYRTDALGASSRFHLVSAAGANAGQIKAAPGRVIGWQLANTTAAWKFVKLHNLASGVTAGANVFLVIPIPPNGKSEVTVEGGVAFSVGIGITVLGGAADTDTTVVAANDVVGSIMFA